MAIVEPFDQEDVEIAGHRTRMFGVLATTSFYHPHLMAGRWLHAQELGTLVISDIAAQRLHAQVGATITLTEGPHRASWQLVGIVHDLDFSSGSGSASGRLGSMFTTLENLDVTLRHAPRTTATQLFLNAHDRSQAALQRLWPEIHQVLNRAGFRQAYVSAPVAGWNLTAGTFVLFETLSVMVALVGLLGLADTLAAEVFERRQQIGILRSLGATGWRVSQVFWIEGLALAGLACVPGILLGFPDGSILVNALNLYLQPLDLYVNLLVIPLTLLFIIVVSFLASFGLGLSASRVRIQETLRYE